MKKLFLFLSIFVVIFGYTFAITQTINETNGVNYGYGKNIYKKGSIYFLSIDYIKGYEGYDAALARAEDGIIFGNLSADFNQNYPKSYYTINSKGERLATKTIRKKTTEYLLKIGKDGREKLISKIYQIDSIKTGDRIDLLPREGIFNNLTETERMILGPSFDPYSGWGLYYIRNTNTKIKNVPFSSSAKITVQGSSLSLEELLNWGDLQTQNLVKVFLNKGKIEGFRVEYHTNPSIN